MQYLLWVLFVLVVAGPAAPAPGDPVGPQFQVNTYTTGSQFSPAVASDGNGGFVVVWDSSVIAGSSDTHSFRGQRFAYTGAPVGPEFQVTTPRSGAFFPAVGPDGSGGFVVVWSSRGSSGTDTDDGSVQAQRITSTGVPLGPQFQVNTYTTGSQSEPAVGPDGSGGFVVAWSSRGSSGTDTDDTSVQAQRITSTGVPLGPQFQVNTYTTGSQREPAVGPDGSGGFVVVWSSFVSYRLRGSIQGQRFASTGSPVGPEFQVNTFTMGVPSRPDVALDGSGGFVVAWPTYYFNIGGYGSWGRVRWQRFTPTGAPVGSEFLGDITSPSRSSARGNVASDGSGGFVVVWERAGVQAQRFSGTGEPAGPEFRVNTFVSGDQAEPSVAPDGSGGFVVVWTSRGYKVGRPSGYGTDTDADSVQGQRFGSMGPRPPLLSGDARGKPERDCFIGLSGYTEADLVPINKKGTKRGIRCTDCDPTCDLDAVPTANGSCTFRASACVNASDVGGCDPMLRTPRKVRARIKSKATKFDLGRTLPDDLTDACTMFVAFDVPVKGKRHDKPGKGKVLLKATKPPDRDEFVFVCDPRPPREACAPTTTTTSTTIPAPGPCTGGESGPFCDLGDGTVFDRSTGLQWEQKNTAVGSGMDVGNLHDVDNRYLWAGSCTTSRSLCQPNPVAAATCAAQTGGALGCTECGSGEGGCDVYGGTTIWDWISQMNAEDGTGFAGYANCHLASESACNVCAICTEIGPPCYCTACGAYELETILSLR